MKGITRLNIADSADNYSDSTNMSKTPKSYKSKTPQGPTKKSQAAKYESFRDFIEKRKNRDQNN